jgi:hypothetical protein
MVADAQTLITEAQELGLFKPQAAFEVHCSNCHGRLDGRGDCPTCGLIGRGAGELERRAQSDPAGVSKLLAAAIAKRKSYRPAGREKSAER